MKVFYEEGEVQKIKTMMLNLEEMIWPMLKLRFKRQESNEPIAPLPRIETFEKVKMLKAACEAWRRGENDLSLNKSDELIYIEKAKRDRKEKIDDCISVLKRGDRVTGYSQYLDKQEYQPTVVGLEIKRAGIEASIRHIEISKDFPVPIDWEYIQEFFSEGIIPGEYRSFPGPSTLFFSVAFHEKNSRAASRDEFHDAWTAMKDISSHHSYSHLFVHGAIKVLQSSPSVFSKGMSRLCIKEACKALVCHMYRVSSDFGVGGPRPRLCLDDEYQDTFINEVAILNQIIQHFS